MQLFVPKYPLNIAIFKFNDRNADIEKAPEQALVRQEWDVQK